MDVLVLYCMYLVAYCIRKQNNKFHYKLSVLGGPCSMVFVWRFKCGLCSHVSAQNHPYLEDVLCSYSGMCPVFQVFHLLFFPWTDPLRSQVLLAFRSSCSWKAGISLCLDPSFSIMSNFHYYVNMNSVGWFCNVQGSSVWKLMFNMKSSLRDSLEIWFCSYFNF